MRRASTSRGSSVGSQQAGRSAHVAVLVHDFRSARDQLHAEWKQRISEFGGIDA
jgi:hypothetical protein